MRLSVSNIAWPREDTSRVIGELVAAGVDGIEVAPTALWSGAPGIDRDSVVAFRTTLEKAGLEVSGIQSLLFGRPDLHLFDESTWPDLLSQLEKMVAVAKWLHAPVAVFGSPRNRLRSGLADEVVIDACRRFARLIEPTLASAGVTLTLEPNAPDYGADFVTTYAESVAVCDAVGSAWIRPQIDTGCLAMVGEDPAAAARSVLPAHVHVSAPNLGRPPEGVEHVDVARALRAGGYDGWVVLEMRQRDPDPVGQVVEVATWLVSVYGEDQQ